MGVDAPAPYSAGLGYGFESAPVDSRYGEHPCEDVVALDDDDRKLLQGAVRVASGARFVIQLAPLQKVRLRIVLASVPHYYGPGTFHYILEPSRIDDISVSVTKGAAGLAIVANDVDLRTSYNKASFDTDVGSYRKIWVTGTAGTDGKLRIGLSAPGGALIPLAAIEVYPFAQAPLVYRRSGGKWLSSPTGGNVPGLTQFHAHDYAGARAAFAGISSPLLRAWAFAFLGGWLTGEDENFDADCIAALTALDSSPALANDPRAIELRDRIEDFAFAERHYRLRAYSFAHAPPPAGFGWFNVSLGAVLAKPWADAAAEKHYYLAENLYAQAAGHSLAPIVAWNAGTQTDPDFEVSPFAFRSLERIALIHRGLNTTHSYINGTTPNPDHLAPLVLSEAIFQNCENNGFLANEFKADHELAMLAWAARPEVHHHSENGGVTQNWDGTPVGIAGFDPSKSWWNPTLLPADTDPVVPIWADLQRRYLHQYKCAVEWWMQNREIDGEYGGGEGDDPELIGRMFLPYSAIEQPQDADVRAKLLHAVDRALESDWVDGGYYSGTKTDVEHTAEFTTYPLIVGLALDPGNPDFLNDCLDVAHHLAKPQPGEVAWSVEDPFGRRRFKSFYFNTDGPLEDGLPENVPFLVDVPLDAKALVPAGLFLGERDNPTLRADLLSWIDAWRHDSLKPHPGKPLGLPPASVRSSDLSFGNAGLWWKGPPTAPSYSFPANMEGIQQLMTGFFMLAHQIDDEGGHVWLVPLLRLFQGVLALDAAIVGGNPPADLNVEGTANWALGKLRDSWAFWTLAAKVRPALAYDPILSTLDDPDVPGTAPYLTPAFLTQLDAAISGHDAGYPTHLAKPQGPIDVTGGTYGKKGKTSIGHQLMLGRDWLENFFPLATSTVLYTDRAPFMHETSHRTLYGMLTGGDVGFAAPEHVVTWATAGAGEPPLDVAILVNDLGAGETSNQPRLRVLLFNFQSVPRSIRCRVWHRLPLGTYVLRTGEALQSTDWFASGVYSQTGFAFAKRGDSFVAQLPPRKLFLFELERTGDVASLPHHDLALAPTSVPLIPKSDSMGIAARVANLGDGVAPAAAIGVRFELLAPDSKSLAKTATLATDEPFAGLPAIDGYSPPAVDVMRSIVLDKPLRKLLGMGCRLRVEFETSVPDTFPTNDATAFEIDAAALLAADPSLVFPKPPTSAKKLKDAQKLQAKKLKQAWKQLP